MGPYLKLCLWELGGSESKHRMKRNGIKQTGSLVWTPISTDPINNCLFVDFFLPNWVATEPNLHTGVLRRELDSHIYATHVQSCEVRSVSEWPSKQNAPATKYDFSNLSTLQATKPRDNSTDGRCWFAPCSYPGSTPKRSSLSLSTTSRLGVCAVQSGLSMPGGFARTWTNWDDDNGPLWKIRFDKMTVNMQMRN
ncbi:predicted protein [Histoplasma capsulatum G186AR]|uniref:Uncharacterized protein n=1 Tax=Ajellomyces capsulatus (strain G186AR / H82 / ATCC MYA-2454 / RMSCC 2432) TaxID=447093 RepID=C0NH69_AJECG|nr:uncharacterized protein HCBG_02691 [Histoplasma capsulatum G186AR]EEH09154.1 predicted protein [Histoplasma capsulatum G186AR]